MKFKIKTGTLLFEDREGDLKFIQFRITQGTKFIANIKTNRMWFSGSDWLAAIRTPYRQYLNGEKIHEEF